MSLDILRKIGLSQGEIKVFSALLELGISPINKIHEKTGIERRNIYDIINKLIERGLVSYIIENKKRNFQVCHPNKIIGYIEEKKYALEKTKEEVEKELPSLIGKYSSNKIGIQAEIFRGVEGVKTVWEDMLNYKNVYWIGSARYVPKRIPNWFAQWNNRRMKAKTRIYNLMKFEMHREEISKPFRYESVKFLPPEFSGSPIAICVFGNKVVNLLLGDEYFGFSIESKDAADNYRRYFKYLWKNVAKEIKKG